MSFVRYRFLYFVFRLRYVFCSSFRVCRSLFLYLCLICFVRHFFLCGVFMYVRISLFLYLFASFSLSLFSYFVRYVILTFFPPLCRSLFI